MDFFAVDVETANENMASICQIGLVRFENGKMVESINQLINPHDYFLFFNTSLHGIDELTVQASPSIVEIWPIIYSLLKDKIVVHHSAFDRLSFGRVSAMHGLPELGCHWLDSAMVARRAWPEWKPNGYGIASLAEMFGVEFEHHNAVEDAAVAGLVLVEACKKSDISLDDWFGRIRQSISGLSYRDEVRRPGSDSGPLADHTIVFTGALIMPRKQAADRAASLGAAVDDVVSRRTTLLVVGDQDLSKLNGHRKSSKHRKAEAMIADGHPIRIIGEADFLAIEMISL